MRTVVTSPLFTKISQRCSLLGSNWADSHFPLKKY